MFEVGKYYRLKMWEPGVDGGTFTEYTTRAVEVHLPLVKFRDSNVAGGAETIVNTASQSFVSAQLAERQQ